MSNPQHNLKKGRAEVIALVCSRCGLISFHDCFLSTANRSFSHENLSVLSDTQTDGDALRWGLYLGLQRQAVALSPILFTMQMKGMSWNKSHYHRCFQDVRSPVECYLLLLFLFAYLLFFFLFPSTYEKMGELIKRKRRGKINKTTNIGPHFGSGLLDHFKLAANFSFYLIFTTELWKCCMSFFWSNRLEDRAVAMPSDLFKSRILVLMR